MDGHPLLGMGRGWGWRGHESFTLVKQHTSRIRALALLWKLHSPPQEGRVGRRQKLKQLGNVFALAPRLHPVPSKVPTRRELHGPSIALFVLAHLRFENPALAHCHQHGLSSHAEGKCNSNVISKYRHVNSGPKAVKNAGMSPSLE